MLDNAFIFDILKSFWYIMSWKDAKCITFAKYRIQTINLNIDWIFFLYVLLSTYSQVLDIW